MINFNSNYAVHFIGIGGVSMHNLALFCADLGWTVTGSDIRQNAYTKECQEHNIRVFLGHRKSNIVAPNFIVKTGGISENNIELKYAQSLGIKIYDRSEFLGELTKAFPMVIAIAGTHGKSTTSYMIFEILKNAGKNVSCHIGADILDSRLNLKDDILVVEACEYKKSFLKLKVDIGAITNIEADHLECYGGFGQLKTAFITFLKHAKSRYVIDCPSTKFLNLKNLKKVEVGELKGNNFSCCNLEFAVSDSLGEQYIMDACLAIKICSDLNIDYKIIYDTLKNFRTLARRQQLLGVFEGKEIIVDYAHHPTEIFYLSKTYERNNIQYVFQPHTFSRTKFLKKEFIDVLSKLNVIIYKEYSAREKACDGISAKQLFNELKLENDKAKYVDNEKQLLELIKNSNCEKVIFVGAGDINMVAERLIYNKIYI